MSRQACRSSAQNSDLAQRALRKTRLAAHFGLASLFLYS
nr:MAG TPA: hypothetical protein [Caudoviricetes sp.]